MATEEQLGSLCVYGKQAEQLVTHALTLPQMHLNLLPCFSVFALYTYATLFPRYHVASLVHSTCSSFSSAVLVCWFALERL